MYTCIYVYTKVSEIVSKQRTKRTFVLLRQEKFMKTTSGEIVEQTSVFTCMRCTHTHSYNTYTGSVVKYRTKDATTVLLKNALISLRRVKSNDVANMSHAVV